MEYRKKVSNNNKQAWANDPGRSHLQSERNKKFLKENPEVHQKMLNASTEKRATHFKVMNPDGILYKENNVDQFCLKHNLPRHKFSDLISGKRKMYQGWRLVPEEISDEDLAELRKLSLDTEIKSELTLSEIAVEHWQNPEFRSKVIGSLKEKWLDEDFRNRRVEKKKKQKETKEVQEKKSIAMKLHMATPGVKEKRSKVFKDKMAGDKEFDKKMREILSRGAGSQIKTFIGVTLVDPEGNQYKDIRNLSQFSRDHRLEAKNLGAVIKGRRKFCKGWRLLVPETIPLK